MKDAKKQLEQFLKALEKDDFNIADSFWIGDWEFTVTGCSPDMAKIKNYSTEEDSKWQLNLFS